MRIFHIFSQKALDPQHLFLGSTKDTRCRTEYFQTRQIPYDECILETRSDSLLLEKLHNIRLDQYTAVFIEYPVYPRSIAYIKQQKPGLRVIVRAHNAELLHYLHYTKIALVMNKYNRILRYLANAVIRLNQEIACGRLADAICTISPWEAAHYWPHLAPSEKTCYLPYFLAKNYLDQPDSQVCEKKNQCVCMLSTAYKEAYFVMDAANNFIREVAGLQDDCPGWTFIISGKSKEGAFKLPSRVQDAGLLPSPLPLLAESRAMAILSNYGFGFKTKILEAIMAGCYILVPKKLYNRLPEEIKPFCLIVDKAPVGMTFGQALSACEKPFPENDINKELRQKAFQVLDDLLGI
jgi:hypothetical protein